ncbi:MAG: hypothetical protein A3E87_07180 [Gammaproteobacteria bacterium RIFCSPHIGHO2_12_FULL_35_23]|nr:MAG: hypothetical protein A3E87_07180 [Gammaproteobacteria bacterium RIFCSPHIGHO2_12_FULL_35_23]
MNSLWLLLLPVAATFGYVSSTYKRPRSTHQMAIKNTKLPNNYLTQLNFLLNEQPDKAVDLFVKLLNVDNETIETHLALGNLFRRRGEVDRAIRIHQNLIGQSQLNQEFRAQALYALAKDYLSAGVLDRAERLFLELVELSTHSKVSYRALLYIYQQEKDWQKAIVIAQKLAAISEHNMQVEIAQYYCELAEIAVKQNDENQARKFLKRAIAVNHNCVRASLRLANIEMQKENWGKALYYLKRVKNQNSDWLILVIAKIQDAYLALNQPEELVEYLQEVLTNHPQMPIVVTLSEQIRQLHGDKAALLFVEEYVKNNPTVSGLHDLLSLQLLTKNSQVREDLELLHELTRRLLQNQSGYHCVNCGFNGATIHWQCPSCKQWETVKPAFLIHDA